MAKVGSSAFKTCTPLKQSKVSLLQRHEVPEQKPETKSKEEQGSTLPGRHLRENTQCERERIWQCGDEFEIPK